MTSETVERPGPGRPGDDDRTVVDGVDVLGSRSPSRAAGLLGPAWDSVLEAEPEIAEMFGDEGPEVGAWLASCGESLRRYFALEDPTRLEPAERESYVETLLSSKLLLRGFVDRLDV